MNTDLESLIEAEMPSGSFFRFQNLGSYKGLSGRGLKEMDFVWWVGDDTLYLLELFSARAYNSRPTGEFLRLCVEKITDSLLFITSVWVPTNYGERINRELNQLGLFLPSYSTIINTSIYIVIGKEWTDEELISVDVLTDTLNSKVSGKTDLIDSSIVSVLDLKYARIELRNVFGNV
jgi:hypothetical protein